MVTQTNLSGTDQSGKSQAEWLSVMAAGECAVTN
jgi:hypothetical protein